MACSHLCNNKYTRKPKRDKRVGINNQEMKRIFLLLTAIALTLSAAFSQNSRPAFRKGYTRLGLQLPGNAVDNTLSLKANMLKGNFGSDPGFVLEKGHIFYFISASKAKLINAGLDWTVFSASLTPTGKSWKNYTVKNTSYDIDDFSTKLVVSVATKLGPVISINPVQDLVIDVRAQASLGVYGAGPVYESYDLTGNSDDVITDNPYNAFYTYPNDEEAAGIKQVTQAFYTMLKPNIGVSVKWRGIGLAADYSPGNINMKYKAIDNGVESTGQQKISYNTFQVKLCLQGKK